MACNALQHVLSSALNCCAMARKINLSDIFMDSDYTNEQIKDKFADIAPYDDSQFADKMEALVAEPGFKHAVTYSMPDVDYDKFVEKLLSLKNVHEFQTKAMAPFLCDIEKKTTAGITASGIENIDADKSYTYISNHRDIVLDASFMDLSLLRADRPLAQVAIGNNLLIYNWISDLVRLNGSFIVKRDVKRLDALKAAQHLSEYIHYAVARNSKSVWIAQREGRAKDSNDRTQESLIKMLSIGGDGTPLNNLLEINLLPVSISYEFDPNDYLKVREYLWRRRNPDFKKSQHDDLLSMETGLLGYKGRVHFSFGKCINQELSGFANGTDRSASAQEACGIIDRTIHGNYKFFTCNYIAYDRLEGGHHFCHKYNEAEVARFAEYIDRQLAKVGEPDITPDEHRFMLEKMLEMYANPVRNYLAVASN